MSLFADNPDGRLNKAISEYDFEGMKNALLEGASLEKDNLILHRVINHDRVDWLEYFLFSSELKEHCDINYKYDHFGEGAAFVYACYMGAIKTVKFIVEDPRLTGKFDFKNIAYNSMYGAFERGSFEVIEYLIKLNKEIDAYALDPSNNFAMQKFIEASEDRKRVGFIEKFILNIDDINLAIKAAEVSNKYREAADKALEVRVMKDSLESSLEDKKENKKPKI